MLPYLRTKPIVFSTVFLGGLGIGMQWADVAINGTLDDRYEGFVIQVNSTATGIFQDTISGGVITRPPQQSLRPRYTNVSSGDWL